MHFVSFGLDGDAAREGLSLHVTLRKRVSVPVAVKLPSIRVAEVFSLSFAHVLHLYDTRRRLAKRDLNATRAKIRGEDVHV